MSRKNKKIILEGKKVYYIGKTKDTGNRIIYFTGKIIKDNKDSTVDVEFVDEYIYNSYEPFIKKNVPLKILRGLK